MSNTTRAEPPPATADTPRARADVGAFIRFLGGATLLVLAAITAIISYQHGLEVVHRTHSGGLVAYLVPLVADLMIASSSLAILDAARNGDPTPVLAWISLVFGIAVTVVMNVAAGWPGGWGSRLLNAVAPVALILSYETLMAMIRRARRRAETGSDPSQAEPEPNHCPHRIPMSAEEAAVVAYFHIRDCEGGKPSQRRLADAFDVNRTKLSQLVREAEASAVVEPVAAVAEAAESEAS